MSKWRRHRSWRRPVRAEVQWEVERIRGQRRGPRWWRPLGGLLVALAVAWVIDPDYPLPTAGSVSVSAREGSYLLPCPLSPLGRSLERRVRFEWQWQGPDVPFDVVLLDAAYDEVARQPGVPGRQWLAEGPVAAALFQGDEFFWLVEGNLRGHRFRCVPAALTFPATAANRAGMPFSGPTEVPVGIGR